MIDEREILIERLMKVGIDKSNATIIALEASFSQCVVNKKYLVERGILSQFIKKALKQIVFFYTGELFDQEDGRDRD